MRVGINAFILALGLMNGVLRAQTPDWSVSVDQWKSSLDQARMEVAAIESNARLNPNHLLTEMVKKAEADGLEISPPADSLRGRAGDIAAAAGELEIVNAAFQSAKQETDECAQQLAEADKQLQEQADLFAEESHRLADEDDRLITWNRKLNDWHDRIEASRRSYHLPEDQPALDAFNREVQQHNAEVGQYDVALAGERQDIAKLDRLREENAREEKLVDAQNDRLSVLRSVQSRKETDLIAVRDKLENLRKEQAIQTAALMKTLGPSLATLHGLLAALDAAGRPMGMFSASNPSDQIRADDAWATATPLTIGGGDEPGNRLQRRIFILPPREPATPDDALADVVRRRLIVEMHADELIGQYRTISPDEIPKTSPADNGGEAVTGVVLP